MQLRDATEDDLPQIVALLSDDPLGAGREGAEMAAYRAAFAAIAANPMHQLIVAEMAGRIVATCQLTILQGLSRGGKLRAQVEAVRVAADLRSKGIGAALMAEAESRASIAGAAIVQLTSDRSRDRAHLFYEGLGYTPSHIGFKKLL